MGLGAAAAKIGLGAKPPPPPPSGCAACMPEMSYTTRLGGFAFCFALGTLLSFLSFTSITSVFLGNPGPFAFKYTIGNILSLCSYGFLVGPAQQCKGMFASDRWLWTTLYFASCAGTLVAVFYLHSFLATVLALATQCVCMVLYALSYLPSGIGLGLLRRLLWRW